MLEQDIEIEKICIRCGDVITGKKIYCSKCYKERKLELIRRSNEKRKHLDRHYPVYTCDCGIKIQLDFYPCTNSFNMIKFDNIKKEHKCQS